jgi:S-adenosylmethionine synthetase
MVDTFGTNTVPESDIMSAVGKVFDLTPRGIISALELRKPIYSATSSYGHFGRKPKKTAHGTEFTWERLDKVGALRNAVGLK